MAYFTEAEIEARTGYVFSATTYITSTEIGTLATEVSAMLDGLLRQTEGDEGTAEWAKQAALTAGIYVVNCRMKGEAEDPEKTLRILKSFLKSEETVCHYDQQYPATTGKW